MDPNHVKGLLHVIGKRVAQRPAPERALDRLQAVRNGRELRAFLATLDLPFSPEVTHAVTAYLDEDWKGRRHSLMNAASDSRNERMDPSS